jgi:hypothetical protein
MARQAPATTTAQPGGLYHQISLGCPPVRRPIPSHRPHHASPAPGGSRSLAGSCALRRPAEDISEVSVRKIVRIIILVVVRFP